MSLVDHSSADPSDAELISRVRGGDIDAYGTLFARHVDAANRLARSISPGPDADDLVSEAFSKVLHVLLDGGGPDLAFRAYLLTAVRRVHVDRIRGQRRAVPTDDLAAYDTGEPFDDTVISGFEGSAAARAFATLPERWQMVLWHLEVEGQKPAQIAPMLGMSANSVSALAYRAREGLRQAFLQMHAADIVDDGCARTHDLLGAYVRGGLSRRDNEKVEQHLQGCRRCTALYLELLEVNSSLAAVLGPLVLGGAATAYLATAGTGLGGGAIALLLGRTREFVAANTQAVVVGGVAAGVVGAAVAGALALGHFPDHPVADVQPPTRVAPPTPGPGTPAPHRHERRVDRPASPAEPTGPPAPTASSATGSPTTGPDGAPAPAPTPPAAPVEPSSGTTGPATPTTPATPDGPTATATPAPPRADLSITLSLSLRPLGLRIAVHGIPPGKEALVDVALRGPHAGSHRLEVAAGSPRLVLPLPAAVSLASASVHIPGLFDPDPTNNLVRISLS